MGQTVKDDKIVNKEQRSKLPRNPPNPYRRSLGGFLQLLFRKGSEKETWGAKLYVTDPVTKKGSYVFLDMDALAETAAMPADGERVLDFNQAQMKARKLADEYQNRPTDMPKGPYLVRHVCAEYVEWSKANGRKAWKDTETRIRSKINCELVRKGNADRTKGKLVERTKKPAIIIGDIPVKQLTTDIIEKWFHSLPRERKSHSKLLPEERRRRAQATANRTLTVLRAALTRAWRKRGKQLGIHRDEWLRVEPYRDVDAQREAVLKPDQIARLTNACPPDLKELVKAGTFTGCRYGELTDMRVSHFSAEDKNVFVAHSKVKKTRYVPLPPQGLEFFKRICAGRPADEFIFLKDDPRFERDEKNPDHVGQKDGKRKWGQSDQLRGFAEAVEKAKNLPAGTVFYSLRHSYATQLKNGGTSAFDIAKALGHSGTQMVEKYYFKRDTEGLRATIATRMPVYDFDEEPNVSEIA